MGRPIRLLSANLLNGGADPTAFADLVMRLQADVVGVQELGPAQAEALADVLPYGQLEPAIDHGGLGLALRYPGEVETIYLAGNRRAHCAELRPGEWPELRDTVDVVNTHITAPHISPFWRSFRLRRLQVGLLVAHLSTQPERPRVLIGDLNATPAWPAYRRLTRDLEDAARLVAARRGEWPRRTWGPWPGSPRCLRIDHALVSHLEVETFEVHPLLGSDHSAILVELRP